MVPLRAPGVRRRPRSAVARDDWVGTNPWFGTPVNPLDPALHTAGFEVVAIKPAEIVEIGKAFVTIYFPEAWDADHQLLDTRSQGLGDEVTEILGLWPMFAPLAALARADVDRLTTSFCRLSEQFEVLAMPTFPILPPRLEDPLVGSAELSMQMAGLTPLANVTGLPALALPVPVAGGPLPASLQLIGPHGAQELFVATGARVEQAIVWQPAVVRPGNIAPFTGA